MVCVKVMCAFCWLSSVEENRTSLLLSVFLCSMGLARKQRADKCVCMWNAAGRQKKVLKRAEIKHAEARSRPTEESA